MNNAANNQNLTTATNIRVDIHGALRQDIEQAVASITENVEYYATHHYGAATRQTLEWATYRKQVLASLLVVGWAEVGMLNRILEADWLL